MRATFSVVLAAAVLCGEVRADETSALKEIKKLQCLVERDDKLPGNPVVGVHFFIGTSVTDETLKVLKELPVVSYHVCRLYKTHLPSFNRFTAGYVTHSRRVQTWSVNPAASAGVRCSYSRSPTSTRSVRTAQQKL
jgi:hypothetical protein